MAATTGTAIAPSQRAAADARGCSRWAGEPTASR